MYIILMVSLFFLDEYFNMCLRQNKCFIYLFIIAIALMANFASLILKASLIYSKDKICTIIISIAILLIFIFATTGITCYFEDSIEIIDNIIILILLLIISNFADVIPEYFNHKNHSDKFNYYDIFMKWFRKI